MARAWQIPGESLVLVRFGNHYKATPAVTSGQYFYSHPAISGLASVQHQYPQVIASGLQMTAVSGTAPSNALFELGLAVDKIIISPRMISRDITPVDFGPDIPAEIMTKIADVTVTMNLINYDPRVLDLCVAEAMAGIQGAVEGTPQSLYAGKLQPTGSLLGHGKPPGVSGNYLVSLNILNMQSYYQGLRPWRFPTSYILGDRTLEFPQGVDASVVKMQWRAIPYAWPSYSGGFQTNPSNFTFFQNTGGNLLLPRVSGVLPDEIISSGLTLWDRTLDD